MSYQKHGQTIGGKTKLYRVWQSMKDRCLNENSAKWDSYGGRGITIDPRWLDFEVFSKDVGERPSPAHTLERVDNNGDYGPGNCKWAVMKDQNRNKRTNVYLTAFGETKLLTEWARVLGVAYVSIKHHLSRGRTMEWIVGRFTSYDRGPHGHVLKASPKKLTNGLTDV